MISTLPLGGEGLTMDARAVREWKAGFDELNRLEAEERCRTTPVQRFAALRAIWRQAQMLGHLAPKAFDPTLTERWLRLRQAYTKRHG